jgi:HEPN domain-containing protein
MSDPKSIPPLTQNQLGDIDHFFTRADTVLSEARNHLKRFNYDLTVRRSQEAFELYLKSLLLFLQKEYPASHDLKKQIYELSEVLKEFQITPQQVARLVLANAVLALWRSPAFYGDEKLRVASLFDSKEAELAVSYGELGQLVCSVVRSQIYRQATTA